MADRNRENGIWWRQVAARLIIGSTLGVVILLGWTLHVDLLKSLLPGSIPTNPLEALVIECAMLSLFLRRHGRVSGWRLRLAQVAAAFVLLIGVTRLFDSIVGADFCPDLVMFSTQLNDSGRIAPLAAFCYTLLGLALLTLDSGRPDATVLHPQVIPALIVPLTIYSFSDWLYEHAQMAAPGGLPPMSMGTSYGLLLSVLVLWNLRRREGPVALITADNSGARMIRYMLPICCYLPVFVIGLAVFGVHRQWFSEERGAALTVFLSAITLVTITFVISSRLRVLDSLRRKTLRELKARAEKDEAAVRISDAMIEMEEVLRTATGSPEESADKLLNFLAPFLGVPQLCLYLLEANEGEPELGVLACYAFGESRQLRQRIALGDGLAGQCAVTQRPLCLDNVPPGYFRIRSGTLDVPPRQLQFLPLVVNGESVGVLEVAALKPLDPEMHDFLLKSARIIAFALYRLREQLRVQRLLDALATARNQSDAQSGTEALT